MLKGHLKKHWQYVIWVSGIILLFGCSTYRPSNPNNICHIFSGEIDWYESAQKAQQRWGTPIYVLMAIMHQESRFIDDAQPERKWFLGIIPLPRASSAFGYAQAQDPAWHDYTRDTERYGADRDDFDDAIDFIGWYSNGTQRRLKLSKWDAYGQYLAYHEGRGGYARKTYLKKNWLITVAKKVKQRAASYNQQLKSCQAKLDERLEGWF